MNISDKAILVTGANRGIGLALVEEALRRGVKRVYAASRSPLAGFDDRVVALDLDITVARDVEKAASAVGSLDVLINNAGIAQYDDLLGRDALQKHLDVNLFGPFSMVNALLPKLKTSRGAIVNVLSLAGVAALPILPAYSISKAAALSFSQSLRARLARESVSVHVVLPGPVDTDMSATLDVPKASPQSVAQRIYDGLEAGEDEIFPDAAAEALAAGWRGGAVKALEREFAGYVA